MNAVAIIQARMGSSRLPGKVLEPIAGRSMLELVVRRVARARSIDAVCIATTTMDRDQPIVDMAERLGFPVFRGSERDVLARYLGAAESMNADPIVRVTSDCPLYSAQLLDEMLARRNQLVRESRTIDHYSNVVRRTYPRGLDTEIVSRSALESVARSSSDHRAREHVTWSIYREPDRFRIVHHLDPTGEDRSAYRWTVDTPEDLEFVRAVYDALDEEYGPWFEPDAVYKLLAKSPEIAHINAHVQQKNA